ncbi:MAG: tRNA uridine-5-carboxymethylaminomethyl(34) synthesis GTPase MnmE [Treponema sp.]|nr:tRNA uridine-5-carboxymethylaminomethyl(34) synthesis GTPase MnmE [Treponema sp.]
MDNTGYTPEEPIAAIATALAPAALGIIRTSGKNCIELVSKVFSRAKALTEASGNTIVYGWIVNPKDNQKIDEVLVSVFKSPKSSTGEDMAEITCHGGPSVVSSIYNLLLENGFRTAERGEFTFRAYINGKTDLTKAEAVKEIIDSRTSSSIKRAAGRLSGSLFKEIADVKKLVVDTLAAIEVEIEYPEDEETIADAFDVKGLKEASSRLSELLSTWKVEKLYQDGVRVVLCGKTNAGKSSLFNALLKEDRAIVSDIEGTTRDWIESWVSFDGIPARLFDTAGLRETEDIVEKRGVERTLDLTKEADLILYLVDSSKGFDEDDKAFFENYASISGEKIPLVLAWNKSDKNKNPKAIDASLQSSIGAEVHISAKEGEGIGALSQAVKKLLLALTGSDRAGKGLGSERQKNAVKEALDRINHAIEVADEGYALDAVVQDLEDSLDSLGEVTGEVTPEDVLDSIFSHFCVGK